MNATNPTRSVAGAVRATVRELAPTVRISLRTGLADRAAVGEAIGLALPERIGARAASGGRSALCLGPDEWVVEAVESDRDALTAALTDISARLPLSAVDISDRETTYLLEGPAVLDLLGAGCPRDLAKMPVGDGARTVFDTAQIILTREAADAFHLTVWRSFVPHVRAILDIATRELAAGL